MPKAASTPQSGVSRPTLCTGDLNPLQLVTRGKQAQTQKNTKTQTVGLLQRSIVANAVDPL